MRFLGHMVTSEGYPLDPADKEAVAKLKDKVPKNVGELRKLLGFIGNYRRNIPSFSKRANPLNDSLKSSESAKAKGRPRKKFRGGQIASSQLIQWTSVHQAALEYLSESLLTLPAMKYPQFDLPFQLHVDASGDGLGAALCHKTRVKDFQ